MVPAHIVAKIHELEIYTRRLLNGALVGDSRSAVKGAGFEFDQLRDYQVGDDIRFIDWNSSARSHKFLVRQYRQERNRNVLLMVDISGSGAYAASDQVRTQVVASIASVLALVAEYGKDHVGLILFSDKVHTFIPPSSGKLHVRHIMESAFNSAGSGTTNIAAALAYVAGLKYKDAVVFLISDFIESPQEAENRVNYDTPTLLRIMSKRHDFIVIRCLDRYEEQFPDLGFITVEDSEHSTHCMIDACSSGAVQQWLQDRITQQNTLFKRCGVDLLSVALDRPFIPDIVRFFRRRMLY